MKIDFNAELINAYCVTAYGQQLRGYLHTKVYVSFKRVQIQNTLTLENNCFENVNDFLEENPICKLQYGWLCCEDYVNNEVVFEPHVVVLDENRQLFDITPLAVPLPFIKSMIMEDDFVRLVHHLHKVNGNARLTVVL